MISWKEICLWD